jgi:predicted RNA binding protein YcfA (HicA-like mRNA interferase family)
VRDFPWPNRQKVLDRLVGGSYNIRFEEFQALLEGFGFELERVRGCHHIYAHPSAREQLSAQPRGDGKAKPYQIRQFPKLVEEYNLTLRDD